MKITVVLIAALATTLLTGCETSSYMGQAATDGTGVTCPKIYQAYRAYNADRQSAQALTELSQLVSPTAGSLAQRGVNSAASYADQIQASVNIALAVRGCQPVG
ncbi:hypothetical protein [Marinobacter caseinilyticus]|uniref:hypothetical protein n=1 Tax=Marinobacter caseinilyticus TaxID=2692195 RepID=UPI001F1A922A|nr:hypothetical protein [Marinobacter caseinilyticus]